ncbi:MAG: hypothetical protein AAB353_01375 [Candidatus Hydrogenedentota bacterium]
MKVVYRAAVLMGAAVVVLGSSAFAASTSDAPTFTKDVLPILQENCLDCHRPATVGTSGMVAPMSLTTYEEVRPWSKAIAKAVQARYMPPWFASHDFSGVFRNERSLSDNEIATIAKWSETGAKRGNPADAPAPLTFETKEWWVGEPDLIVQLPEPVWVGDDVQDWQPNIDIPLTADMLPEDRWIRAIECVPGNTEIVHHIVLYKKSEGPGGFGQNIGGLAPGSEPSLIQDGYGILLEKGSILNANMHYHKEAGPGTGAYDQSRLGFHFYPKGQEIKPIHIAPIGNMDFEIPPGRAAWTVGMAQSFDKSFKILSYLPHMHLRGVKAEYVAHYPDGKTEHLLDVPAYDYNWQLNYEYAQAKSFPAGTRIEAKMWFDNSTANVSNPDPNKSIRFGIETTAEMALAWMYYTIDGEEGATSDYKVEEPASTD